MAILGGCDYDVCEAAFQYGQHTGLAFQLMDDMLDYMGTAEDMGKPTASDLRLGLATAPVLYAAEEVRGQALTDSKLRSSCFVGGTSWMGVALWYGCVHSGCVWGTECDVATGSVCKGLLK